MKKRYADETARDITRRSAPERASSTFPLLYQYDRSSFEIQTHPQIQLSGPRCTVTPSTAAQYSPLLSGSYSRSRNETTRRDQSLGATAAKGSFFENSRASCIAKLKLVDGENLIPECPSFSLLGSWVTPVTAGKSRTPAQMATASL